MLSVVNDNTKKIIRQVLVGKVIDWELYKKFKFNHTNKWYMQNSESSWRLRRQNSMGVCDTNISSESQPGD